MRSLYAAGSQYAPSDRYASEPPAQPLSGTELLTQILREDDRATENARANKRATKINAEFDARLSNMFNTSEDPTVAAVRSYEDTLGRITSLCARGPGYYDEAYAEYAKLVSARDEGRQTLGQMMAVGSFDTPNATRIASVASALDKSEFNNVQISVPGVGVMTLGAMFANGLGWSKDYLNTKLGGSPAVDIITGEVDADGSLRDLLKSMVSTIAAVKPPAGTANTPVIDKSPSQVSRSATYVVNNWPKLLSDFTTPEGIPAIDGESLARTFRYINNRSLGDTTPAYADAIFSVLKTRFDRLAASGEVKNFDIAQEAGKIISFVDKMAAEAYDTHKVLDFVGAPSAAAQMDDLVFTTVGLFASSTGLDFDNKDVQNRMSSFVRLAANARAEGWDLVQEMTQYAGSRELAADMLNKWASSDTPVTSGPIGAILSLRDDLMVNIQGSAKTPGATGTAPTDYVVPAAVGLASVIQSGITRFMMPRILGTAQESLASPDAYAQKVKSGMFSYDESGNITPESRDNMVKLANTISEQLSRAGVLTGNDEGSKALRGLLTDFATQTYVSGPNEMSERLSVAFADMVVRGTNPPQRVPAPADLGGLLNVLAAPVDGDPVDLNGKPIPLAACRALGLCQGAVGDPPTAEEARVARLVRNAANALVLSQGLYKVDPTELAAAKAYATAEASAQARAAVKAQTQGTDGGQGGSGAPKL